MPTNWILPPQKKLLVSSKEELVEQLLLNRKLTSAKSREDFFEASLDRFKKELELEGIEKAAARIKKAIDKEELIVVYGDYDVDGICGSAILYLGLTLMGAKVFPYIPHREKEGYGLSKEGLQAAKEKGAGLVVTVDNGIVATAQAELAKTLGLDLIVTDHHTVGKKLPQVVAIVHSLSLSGSGVAWCLIDKMLGREKSEELLDLVAIATVCDMVSLSGVNRALVKAGTEKLKKTDRVGLLALFTECGIAKEEIDSTKIGHILGPRLNAIGRLEHSIDALRLLCTKDIIKARGLARLLCETNDQKKLIAQKAFLQARVMASEQQGKKILVLESSEWIQGVIGLIAARVSEEYCLPTVVISRGELFSKGSARTVNGIDIVETIRSCQSLLLDIGGHPQAAGFTIETAKISEFRKMIEGALEEQEIDQNHYHKIEAVIDPAKVDLSWVKAMEELEPFGVDNPNPVLGGRKVKISDIKTVGSNKDHLKFKAAGIEAIAFFKGSLKEQLREGQPVDLAFNLEIDRFNGSEKLQFKVLDIQP